MESSEQSNGRLSPKDAVQQIVEGDTTWHNDTTWYPWQRMTDMTTRRFLCAPLLGVDNDFVLVNLGNDEDQKYFDAVMAEASKYGLEADTTYGEECGDFLTLRYLLPDFIKRIAC